MRHQGNVIAAQQAGPRLRKAALRQTVPIALVAVFLLLLQDRAAQIDGPAVIRALGQVAPLQWLAALGATVISFWALGHYDAVLHRHLGTELPESAARSAGIAAIAVSQTVGFGLVTGALVRWRLLPGLSLWQATQITAFVALSFLMGLAVVISAAIALLPGHAALRLVAGAVVMLAVGLVIVSILAPPIRIGQRTIHWPSATTIGRILALTAIDTLAAAMVFWVLIPGDIGLAFSILLPAFLVALGAGLVSGTPGGVGPFEIALLGLLPQFPAEPLLAAILAYRAVYFAGPAILSTIAVAAGPRGRQINCARPQRIPPTSELAPQLALMIDQGPRAEALLLRQGEHGVLIDGKGQSGAVLAETRQALVTLFDPFGASEATSELMRSLRAQARRVGKSACCYKIGADLAQTLGISGWKTLNIAQEAWLCPAEFTLQTPSRSGLRRKLRKAEKAGVTVESPDILPMNQLTEIAADWAKKHGGQRGFSMGRFAANYVAGQKVFVAYENGLPIAFVSFHTTSREWTLDLMRQVGGAPDGTMHALVVAAIDAAKGAAIPRISLAALPVDPTDLPGLITPIWRRYSEAGGLRQFKSAFDPNTEPLFIAAPSWPAMMLAGIDIARAIRQPAPADDIAPNSSSL